MPRKYYDIAFKQDAVQRALTTDGSVSELERELGLGRGMLFRWIKEARGKKKVEHRTRYTLEEKKQMLKKAEQDRSIRAYADRTGLNSSMLYRWARELKEPNHPQRREDTQAEDALAQENHLLRELLKYYLGRP